MSKPFKVTFELEPEDTAYFRDLYRKAKASAAKLDPDAIVKDAKKLVETVRQSPRIPGFVKEAIATLEDMTQIILDPDYAAPQSVKNQVLAGLAYFANSEDLIPDHVPALGFLDDAIMVKLVEEEFKHELWGYRRFRGLGAPEEQRPWTQVGGTRLRERTDAHRRKIRAAIAKRKAAEEARGGQTARRRFFGW
jgi:uncharacterized membrane protein YkvA (DUF1232 family)